MEGEIGCGENGDNIPPDFRLSYTQPIASFGTGGSGDGLSEVNDWSLFGVPRSVSVMAPGGDVDGLRNFEADGGATGVALPERDACQLVDRNLSCNVAKAECNNTEEVKLLLEDYKCPICLDIFINTVKVDCSYGHKFCSYCIQCWISIGSQLVTDCPVCRDPIFGKRLDLKTEAEIRFIVDQLPEEEKSARLVAIKERLQKEFPNVNFQDECHVEFPTTGSSADIPHRGLHSPLWELAGAPRAPTSSTEARTGVHQYLDLGSHVQFPGLHTNGQNSMYTSQHWNSPYPTLEIDEVNGREGALNSDFQNYPLYNYYNDRWLYNLGAQQEENAFAHNGMPWCQVHGSNASSTTNAMFPPPPHNFPSERFTLSQIHSTCPSAPAFVPYSAQLHTFCRSPYPTNAAANHPCCYQPFCPTHSPLTTIPTAMEQQVNALSRFAVPGRPIQQIPRQPIASSNVSNFASANRWDSMAISASAGGENGTMNNPTPRLIPRMPAMFGMSFHSPWPVSMLASSSVPNSGTDLRSAQTGLAGHASAFSLQSSNEGNNLSTSQMLSSRPSSNIANPQTSTLDQPERYSSPPAVAAVAPPTSANASRGPFGGRVQRPNHGDRGQFSGGFSIYSGGYVGFQVSHTPTTSATVLPDPQNPTASSSRITHPIVSLTPLSRDGSATRISLTFEIHRQ